MRYLPGILSLLIAVAGWHYLFYSRAAHRLGKQAGGLEDEWGYFLLSELKSARGPFGLAIERDLYFTPGPFTKVVPAK